MTETKIPLRTEGENPGDGWVRDLINCEFRNTPEFGIVPLAKYPTYGLIGKWLYSVTLNHVFRVRISVSPQTLRVYNKCFSFKFKVNGNSWRTGVEIMDFDFLPKVLFHFYFEKSLLV